MGPRSRTHEPPSAGFVAQLSRLATSLKDAAVASKAGTVQVREPSPRVASICCALLRGLY
jgi:hypothetical protein